MKNNNWIKNIVCLILIAVLAWCGSSLLASYYEQTQRTYESKIFVIILLHILFYGGIGAILGFDNLTREIKKEGIFKVNIPRLLVLGLPSIALILPYSYVYFIPSLMKYIDTLTLISSIVFGYTLITSIVKEAKM